MYPYISDFTTSFFFSFILFFIPWMFLFLGNIIKSGSTDENSAPIQHSSLLHQKLYESHAEFWTSFNTHCQVGKFLDSFLEKIEFLCPNLLLKIRKNFCIYYGDLYQRSRDWHVSVRNRTWVSKTVEGEHSSKELFEQSVNSYSEHLHMSPGNGTPQCMWLHEQSYSTWTYVNTHGLHTRM